MPSSSTPSDIAQAAERLRLVTELRSLESSLQRIRDETRTELTDIERDLEQRKLAFRDGVLRQGGLKLRAMERNVRTIEQLYQENRELMAENRRCARLTEVEERLQARLEATQRYYDAQVAEAKERARQMEDSCQSLEALLPEFHHSVTDLEKERDFIQECGQAEYRTKLMYHEFTATILQRVHSSGVSEISGVQNEGLDDSIHIESFAPRLVRQCARTA